MDKAPIFQKTYEDYLHQVGLLDLETLQSSLGFDMEGSRAAIPLFDQVFLVNGDTIQDTRGRRADLGVAVLLCKYLLMCPAGSLQPQTLKTFKDFKDAAPLINYFDNAIQQKIARDFCGQPQALDHACRSIGGNHYGHDLAYEVKYEVMGLPRVPVYVLFNDAEDGFAAQCVLLFEQRAENYLDMESLAIMAGTLVARLNKHRRGVVKG